jgi:hypothetical protein
LQKKNDPPIKAGDIGTVVVVRKYDVGIEWDNKLPYGYGHDCDGKCKDGYGTWVFPQDIIIPTLPEFVDKVRKKKKKGGDRG